METKNKKEISSNLPVMGSDLFREPMTFIDIVKQNKAMRLTIEMMRCMKYLDESKLQEAMRYAMNLK